MIKTEITVKSWLSLVLAVFTFVIMTTSAITYAYQGDGFYRHTFWYPRYQSARLDACYSSKSHCGWRAANAYCRVKGFNKALFWRMDYGVRKTRMIGNSKRCKSGHCTGYSYLTCGGHSYHRPPTRYIRMIHNPLYKGNRLDSCSNGTNKCSQRAASNYCRYRGYRYATDWRLLRDVPPTRVMNSKKMCRSRSCDSYRWVRCAL